MLLHGLAHHLRVGTLRSSRPHNRNTRATFWRLTIFKLRQVNAASSATDGLAAPMCSRRIRRTRPVRITLSRSKTGGHGVRVYLRDWTVGVPALKVGEEVTCSERVTRTEARGADPVPPQNILDPGFGDALADVSRARPLWDRDHRDRAAGLGTARTRAVKANGGPIGPPH
jgi:hypothetical protein